MTFQQVCQDSSKAKKSSFQHKIEQTNGGGTVVYPHAKVGPHPFNEMLTSHIQHNSKWIEKIWYSKAEAIKLQKNL